MFDEITVEEVSADKKQSTAREILEALPDWFGIPESREQYIKESAEQPLPRMFRSLFCLRPTDSGFYAEEIILLIYEMKKRMHTVRLFFARNEEYDYYMNNFGKQFQRIR